MYIQDDETLDFERFREDHMNAYNLTYPPVSPGIRALAERLRKNPPVKPEPPLNEMDKAVLRAQGGAI